MSLCRKCIPEEQQEIAEVIDQYEDRRFIEIPRHTSREGWKRMEQFILSMHDQDEDIRNQLLDAIQGRGLSPL